MNVIHYRKQQIEEPKHAWLNQNLDCTAHEYESAMRRILKEIGL